MKYSQVFTTAALSATVVYAADDNPYTQYPSVAKTASINGFADKIYGSFPDCAKECLTGNSGTGSTPCPYWDTGCLCVMPQFGGPIAACIAESCEGSNVVSATKLAEDNCSAAGVWEPYWMLPSDSKDLLDAAAAKTEEPTTSSSSTAAPETSAAPTTSEAPQTSAAPGTSEAPETTAAPSSQGAKPAESAASSEAQADSQAPAESKAPEGSNAASSAAAASSKAASNVTTAVPSVSQENNAINNYPGLIGSFGAVAAGLALFI